MPVEAINQEKKSVHGYAVQLKSFDRRTPYTIVLEISPVHLINSADVHVPFSVHSATLDSKHSVELIFVRDLDNGVRLVRRPNGDITVDEVRTIWRVPVESFVDVCYAIKACKLDNEVRRD